MLYSVIYKNNNLIKVIEVEWEHISSRKIRKNVFLEFNFTKNYCQNVFFFKFNYYFKYIFI